MNTTTKTKKGKLAVLGGDMRQIALAEGLFENGYEIGLWGVGSDYEGKSVEALMKDTWQEAIREADAVILPLPVSSDGIRLNCPLSGDDNRLRLTVLFDHIGGRIPVYGGKCSQMVRSAAEGRGVHLIDYFNCEDLQIRNAVPTAEGAIAIAMNELPITIDGCRAAVIGYGRVGKELADRLKALGAEVGVAARKQSDLAWIRNRGMLPLPMGNGGEDTAPEELAEGYDVIFNTVPVWLFDEALVKKLPKGLLFIDLASAPGGIDVRAAKEHGLHVIWALSLPGKCAPYSAGRAIADTLLGLLEERKERETL